MRKDIMEYIDIIKKMRVDDFYDAFSMEELIELIDESEYLWEDGELKPANF